MIFFSLSYLKFIQGVVCDIFIFRQKKIGEFLVYGLFTNSSNGLYILFKKYDWFSFCLDTFLIIGFISTMAWNEWNIQFNNNLWAIGVDAKICYYSFIIPYTVLLYIYTIIFHHHHPQQQQQKNIVYSYLTEWKRKSRLLYSFFSCNKHTSHYIINYWYRP